MSKNDYPTDGPVLVEVVNEGSYSRIYRNGSPYYIKGGAYNNFLSEIPKYGGNSVRTYSIDENTQSVLDSALKYELTVCLGIWVGRETYGFDYDDEEAIAEQLAEIKNDVMKYKDHPALLMWGIGNEVNGQYTNMKVWNAVGEISDMIHELDPYHLTTTVLAGTEPDDINEIIERAPSLDVLSVNSYSGIINAQTKIASTGWSKPYLVTEWGPRGTYANPPKTSWGAPQELTSTEKGEVYRTYYSDHIASNLKNSCNGSYVFLWGYQTHGQVATWYGLFTRNGNPFESVHSMQYCWLGSFPSNRPPRIERQEDVLLNGMSADKRVKVVSGKRNQATVKATDLEGEQLTYEWVIVKEGFILDKNDTTKSTLPGIAGLFESNTENTVYFTVPEEGEYRLYAFVFDEAGNVASAAIPFMVEDL
ncbi:MAG: glycoside hydrolase family 2 TIM barrel-domain containing protein [Cyclobacteriaceae bacterium]